MPCAPSTVCRSRNGPRRGSASRTGTTIAVCATTGEAAGRRATPHGAVAAMTCGRCREGPAAIEEHVPLARHTTIGTGGPARFFARPGRSTSSWSCSRGRATRPRGRDDRARVEPARARRRRRRARAAARRRARGGPCRGQRSLVAGGGATNAVCLHRARDAGLGGFEFASAIPGTVGGGVRMNAGAYGRDWRASCSRRGRRRRRRARASSRPRSSSSAYRHSALAPGQVVAQVRAPARAAAGRGDQGDGRRAARAAEGDAADEQANVRQRLQEPARRAEARAADRGVRAEGPPDRRRADLAAARELHRERGRRDVGRRARADGRGAAARARAVRRRARARGAIPRPARAAAAVGERPGRSEPDGVAARRRATARAAALPARRRAGLARPRFLPSPRSLASGRARSPLAVGRVRGRARDVGLRGARARDRRRLAARSRPRSQQGARARARTQPRRGRAEARSTGSSRASPDVLSVALRPRVPAHAARRRHARAAGAAAAPGRARAGSSPPAGACCARSGTRSVELAAARVGSAGDGRQGRRDARPESGAPRSRRRSRRSPAAASRRASHRARDRRASSRSSSARASRSASATPATCG